MAVLITFGVLGVLKYSLSELAPKGSLRRHLAVWIYYVLAPHKGLALNTADIQDLTEVRNMLAKNLDQWERETLEQGIEQEKQNKHCCFG